MKKVNNNNKGFNKNFWTAIFMEFIERGSYYGVMSVLSVYLVMSLDEGGLGFSRQSVGAIKSTIVPLLYLIPIFSGAIADRFGYRKILFFAFSLMSIGYFFAGFSASYHTIFASLLIMAFGCGLFKPIVSATISRETTEENSSLGFGIFYWSINLGSFLFPLLLVPYLKHFSFSYIFFLASFCTFMLLWVNLFVYKEPKRKENQKTFSEVIKEMVLVLKDFRFVIMIVIYSGFWILYFQMFDTVLWYVRDYVDASSLNIYVNKFLSLFVSNPNWKFDIEHVTVINAGAIISLQILISAIVKKWKALPTMCLGIGFGTLGMLVISVSSSIWVFIIGTFVFTIGEMVAHPKFISYIGQTSPEDKKALYMGYSFLFGVIGSGVGGILGAYLYVYFVDQLHNPTLLWLTFSAIGFSSIIGLLLFDWYYNKRKKA